MSRRPRWPASYAGDGPKSVVDIDCGPTDEERWRYGE